MAGGRPTKLTPDLIEKAKTYLDTCVDNTVFTDKGAIAYTDVNLPTTVGFAIYLGINKDTVYEWRKGEDELSKQFSDILSIVEDEQEKRVLNKGLGGLYNTKIGSMILARRGYAERTETDITTKGKEINTLDPKSLDIAKRYEEELKKDL